MIRFERASFAYRPGAEAEEAGKVGKAGVRDVSLEVRPGEVVVLCGRSGCGKSTLLRLANGLAPRFFPGRAAGRVLLDGEEVGALSSWRIAERAGSLFQNPRTQFFNVDTTGEVAFALESAGWPEEAIRARVGATLRELGLEHLAGRSIFDLSGGQRQKIAYASVWALRPPNLLLDEPTSNLDAPSIADIAAFVANAKASRPIVPTTTAAGPARSCSRRGGCRSTTGGARWWTRPTSTCAPGRSSPWWAATARARPRCAGPCAAWGAGRGGRSSWTDGGRRADGARAHAPWCSRTSTTNSSPPPRRPR